MRYLITLSVEGLEAASATAEAAFAFFDAHPEYAGEYVSFEPDEF
jgi:hypothetical protein